MKLAPHPPVRARSGIALVVALVAIAVLSILAAGLALMMKTELRLAQNAGNDEQIYWLGRSGCELARWVLAQEAAVPNEPYDSLNQIWAGGPGGLGETNSALVGLSLQDFPVGNGTVSLKFIDLERKININAASPTLLRQVLTVMGVDANDVSVVADSIGDWIDADDMPRTAGAESEFYQTMTPPYDAKNAPIDDLGELLYIRGVTPGMMGLDNTPTIASHPHLGFGNAPGQEPDYKFHLQDVFTPFSTGKININTADLTVLETLPGVDENLAQDIIKARSGPDGQAGTEDDTPFVNVGELAKIDPQLPQLVGPYCDVHSHTFEVHIDAHLGPQHREFVAILLRNGPQEVQVVGFRWK